MINSKVTNMLSSSVLIQNICKEEYLAKKPEDTHTYTDNDTENFKIFFMSPFFILQYLETTVNTTIICGADIQNILWCFYWTIYTILLRTCRGGGVIPYYTHSSSAVTHIWPNYYQPLISKFCIYTQHISKPKFVLSHTKFQNSLQFKTSPPLRIVFNLSAWAK